MVQIITQQGGGGGGGGGGTSYTAGNGINIENDEISVDESVVQTTDNLVTNLTNPDDTHYPSAKAVSDALSCAGAGDMLKSVYDPNNVNADAFDYDNFINTPTIPTNNNQLTNGCGYITDAALSGYAKTCDIPTDNCQLANGCGYTTCTGTLTASNISNTAYGSSWSGVTTVAPSKNAVYAKVSAMDALIPSAATSSNQLADKDYVNDSINSVTAFYITKNAAGDQFATYAELAAATTFYSGGEVRVPTRNDYTIVLDDETHSDEVTRYIYNNGWEYQYTINESPLTQAQLDALNSGITAAKVSAYDSIPVITDNCQIANGCGYTTCTGTISTCSQIISTLGYTPYNSTNPNGYTTCTGTITEICMNGCSCGTSGVVDLGTISGGGSYVDLLVIGGGGAGECCFNSNYLFGSGGGAGQIVERYGMAVSCGVYNVVIGAGGTTRRGNGGASCFGGSVIANGGCGAYCCNTTSMGGGTSGMGYSGAVSRGNGGGGGGGACGFGSQNGCSCCGGNGGDGMITTFDGSPKFYGGGGTGAGSKGTVSNSFGGGKGSTSVDVGPSAPTTCGSGGGGGARTGGRGCGACGMVQVRYLSNGCCGITCATGGTVTTACGFTIHTFTSDGTFTIVS